MKKLAVIVALTVSLTMVLTACATPATPTEAPAPTQAPAATAVSATAVPATEAPAKPFRVALIMPSTTNDLAFGQSMYDALVKVQTDMGGPDKMELVKSENVFTADDAASAMRDYATQGYNLIIAHGSQYGSA